MPGVAMKAVSERLGHSSITVTADSYSHSSSELYERAVEDFAR